VIQRRSPRWVPQTRRALLLDGLTAAAAWSVRRIGPASVPLVRVRRDSDNDELDVTDASSWLDQAVLLDFCGAASGFIAQAYDQTGSGRHGVQATSASQPRIVNAGVVETFNGRPAMLFSGAQSLSLSTTVPAQAALSYNAVIRNGSASGTKGILAGASGSAALRLASLGLQVERTFQASVFSHSGSIANGAAAVVTMVGSGSGTDGALNGALESTATLINATQPTSLIGSQAGSNFMVGHIAEAMVFLSSLSTTDRQRIERDQGPAFGITVS
jgi:hypothetical protein